MALQVEYRWVWDQHGEYEDCGILRTDLGTVIAEAAALQNADALTDLILEIDAVQQNWACTAMGQGHSERLEDRADEVAELLYKVQVKLSHQVAVIKLASSSSVDLTKPIVIDFSDTPEAHAREAAMKVRCALADASRRAAA